MESIDGAIWAAGMRSEDQGITHLPVLLTSLPWIMFTILCFLIKNDNVPYFAFMRNNKMNASNVAEQLYPRNKNRKLAKGPRIHTLHCGC